MHTAGASCHWPRLTLEAARALTNQAIARRPDVAPRTAKAHVENIRCKLGVRSRAQMAAWVTEHLVRQWSVWLRPGWSRLLGHRPRPAVRGRPLVLRHRSKVLIRQVHSADAPLLADGFAG